MIFCPIASGSSGNCVYVGTNTTHILVDAGLSGKRIEAALAQLGVNKLSGILVTHEHSDHVSGVGVLSRRYKIPVYATPYTWRFLLRHGTIGTIADNFQHTILPGVPVMIGDMEVLPFDVSHDASQPVGYCLQGNGYKAVVATDMGYVTDTARDLLKNSHVLLIESNYDIEMLKYGKYPQALKERVMSSRGHLSNVAAGALLAEIVSDTCEHVFLGHLSEENNRPLIALDTVQNILDANNIRINSLSVAFRHEPSEMIKLN
ncbi:MAG: MBL fold metallo-hydrolase [Defluviitaleaceae bacterium]|nr:MBL fold metallo-hydrolase [Defluviitaleaceae bacterium]